MFFVFFFRSFVCFFFCFFFFRFLFCFVFFFFWSFFNFLFCSFFSSFQKFINIIIIWNRSLFFLFFFFQTFFIFFFTSFCSFLHCIFNFLFWCTLHDKFNIIFVNGFFFKKNINHCVNFIFILFKNFTSFRKTFIDNLFNFTVNHTSFFFRIWNTVLIISSNKHLASFSTKVNCSNCITHSIFSNHCTGKVSCSFNVAWSTSSDVIKEQFFRSTSTEQHCNFVKHFSTSHVCMIIFWLTHCITSGSTTLNDWNFVNRLIVFNTSSNNSMSRFVISSNFLVFIWNYKWMFSFTHFNFNKRFINVFHYNLCAIEFCSTKSCFVHKVFKIGTSKTNCNFCNVCKVNITCKWFIFAVHSQNFFATFNVWTTDINLTVKSSRSG